MQKTILITGCSSGIGLDAALTLHKKGYRVFAAARKPADVEKLKVQGLESLVLDIDDSNSIRNAVKTVLEKTGGTLDALFNNAGYMQPGAVEDITRDVMRSQFETNVFGTMELTNLIIPVMRKQGYGKIVFNTSILGIVAMPYRGVYNASKFALEGFANTLRQELHDANIQVAIIAPGPVESKLRATAHHQYESTLATSDSIHQPLYKKMEKYFFNPADGERRFTKGPEAVTEKLLCALESKKPKAHYYVSFPAHLFAFLHRILPDCCMDWVMNKVIEGEKK